MSTFTAIANPSSFVTAGAEFASALIEKKSAVFKHIAQSERLAGIRPASRLEVRRRSEMISIGIPELDALTGGIPRGCLTEVCGQPSSGKTSVLLAALAAATQRGESSVLIDASDSFDPGSAATAGVDFSRLLWIRCGTTSYAENRSPAVGRRLSVNPASHDARPTTHHQFPWVPHPSALFAEGGDFDFAPDVRRTTHDGFPERLEQVLKSTDLILQSGGFGLVALDLAGIPNRFVHRIPLASWFRFQRAVEHTKTALLVISEIACAQTCAAVVMKVWNQASGFRRQASEKPSHVEVLKESQIEAEILRSRLERKPMQSVKTMFTTHAVRAG